MVLSSAGTYYRWNYYPHTSVKINWRGTAFTSTVPLQLLTSPPPPTAFSADRTAAPKGQRSPVAGP